MWCVTGTFVVQGDCYVDNAIDFDLFAGVFLSHEPFRKPFETLPEAIEWLNHNHCGSEPRLFREKEILLERTKIASEMENKKIFVVNRVERQVKKWYSNYTA